MTECIKQEFKFQGLNNRNVVGSFDGGNITSDGGSILLRDLEIGRGIIQQFSECFTDYRDSRYIEHTVYELLRRRIFGIALGYEDLNDHDQLRNDPNLALASGKADITGESRKKIGDKGKSLAGKSTLNRLELKPSDANKKSRYKKVVYNGNKIEGFFIETYLQSLQKPPERIVLDLDATDDLI